MSWSVRPSLNPALQARLEQHGGVLLSGEPVAGLAFWRDDWNRQVTVGEVGGQAVNGPLFGLVELADNNPLVCADVFSVPSPEAALALIGLGPVVRSGLLLDDPVVQLSFESEGAETKAALTEMGWTGDLVIHVDAQDLRSVRAAVCMAEIPAMPDYSVIDDLFEESYGRSFFVRSVDALAWDIEQVEGKDHAVYSLRVSPFEDRALLTVLVMGDVDGKLGAAQMVHAMNVMCGFEEHLGLQSPF
jgi:hypothetical protein